IMANKKKVIVTGFEPFGEHTVNSSWVAVQELDRLGLGEAVDLYVCEVPVEYQAVQSLLPSLWKQHQPQVSVRLHLLHVFVSGAGPVCLHPRASTGEALQQLGAWKSPAGDCAGDAGAVGAGSC
uniref:Pyroglutamyl-peptidase I n=1 Tax=Myripristis murdjan TaxID=586833 RepID=A0A667YY00_9TELE